ncbi:hypothetical protein MRX96_017400 [Rhipicephalus microplus]
MPHGPCAQREQHPIVAGEDTDRSAPPFVFRAHYGPGAQGEQHALVAGEANSRGLSPFMFRGPYRRSAQRKQQALVAGEATRRSISPFTFLGPYGASAQRGSTGLWRVKTPAGEYRRLGYAGLMDPVLRESSMRSMRVKPVAEA